MEEEMAKVQKQVTEFHTKFGLPVGEKPHIPEDFSIYTQVKLINEEYGELIEAITKKDLIGIADGLGDLIYVVYGLAVRFGINMKPISDEIQRSNMTKVGGYFNDEGKYCKPDNYSPPYLLDILKSQMMRKDDGN